MYRLHSTFFCIIVASSASACNIPVFRYALERWRQDPIEVIILQNGPLTADASLFTAELQKRSADFGGNANVAITHVDLASDDPGMGPYRQLWKSLRAADPKISLPHVVVRSGVGRARKVPIWNGSIDEATRANLLQSPSRRELSRRLVSGHAIVWLMLRSSNEKRNEETRRMLTNSFTRLASEVQLPEGIGLPGSELHSEVPLLLKYSILEIDPDDPKEQFLAGMLRRLQPDSDVAKEPLLVPIFGRARALEVIPASDLDDSLITDLTVFLCGACSCQVKERNPGFDLLLTSAWDTELFGEGGVAPPDTSAGRNGNGKPKLLTIPPGR